MLEKSRLVLRIPGTGKQLKFAAVREAMVRRNAWLGMRTEAQRKALLEQFKDFERVGKAIDVWNETHSYAAVKRAIGVSRKGVKNWILGRTLPHSISPKKSAGYSKFTKPLKINSGKLEDFAYVLGSMTGNASANILKNKQKQGVVVLGVKSSVFAKAFARAISSSLGLPAKAVQRGKHYYVEFASVNLIKLFNELSQYGEDLPLGFFDPKSPMKEMLSKNGSPTRFLRSVQERKFFVRAFFDSRGRIKGSQEKKYVVVNPMAQKMRDFIFVVLMENGLHPKIWKTGEIVLPYNETEKFRERIGSERLFS